MSESIRVVVHGALGRMGKEVVNALCQDPETDPVGAVDLRATEEQLALPDGSGSIPFSSELESMVEESRPNVLVDFTLAQATMPAVQMAVRHKVNLVIGTTGLSASDLDEIDKLTRDNGLGAVVASNFALGAIMMMHLSEVAAKFFDWAEIIELHHEQKADAPSGTALSTAKALVRSKGGPFSYASAEKEPLRGTRGGQVDGVGIHSVRLPGLSAHQEVVFGAPGQTLTIRHDTIDRRCYMPGVLLAVKKVSELKGLTNGLDVLLGLKS
jgi:4-hydroxy-tetrahydrodipicolinate reductase